MWCDCSGGALTCVCVSIHAYHQLHFAVDREYVRLFCVRRGAWHMNVYNSGTAVVKPQWPAGICKVSCSGFLIRCKTLTDLLRQQKNLNQLGDIIHCLLIFICDSRWLHQVYQGNGEAVEEDASVTEKYLTGKMWWNKQREKEVGGQRRWERKNERWERWWILKCQFAQIICKVFVLSQRQRRLMDCKFSIYPHIFSSNETKVSLLAYS